MEEIRRKRMLWWIPSAAAILFALFWGIWYLVAGKIPVVISVDWTKMVVIQLPFAISRAWDIVFAPILAIVLILLFTDSRIREEDKDGVRWGLIFGLSAGFLFGPVVDLAGGLGFILFWAMFFGPGAGLIFAVFAGLGVVLGAGIISGVVFGWGVGLIFGLVIGLVFSLSPVLIIGSIIGLKFILRKFQETISQFFSGK